MNDILNFYKDKKVFITGHTGFKGSWLATWLHMNGAEVKGYALAPENDACLFNAIKSSLSIQSVINDIRNKVSLTNAITSFQPDLVFHLAAQPLVRKSYEIPSETFEVNVVGTTNLLEGVNKLPGKCTVVIITTDKVYANRETGHYYTEEDRLGGYDPYSASKAAAEIAVDSFRSSFFNTSKYHQHQKAVASVRAGNVIGGGDFSKDRIIPDIVQALKQEENITVRNPAAVRPWQHVLEPLSGYLLLGKLLHEDAVTYTGAYNFGPKPEDHLTVKELVETAIHSWGAGEWKDVSDAAQPHEAGLLNLDISKAFQQLGWQPKLNSSEAIQWTIDWYKQTAETVVAYTFDQVKNYQQR